MAERIFLSNRVVASTHCKRAGTASLVLPTATPAPAAWRVLSDNADCMKGTERAERGREEATEKGGAHPSVRVHLASKP